MIVVVYTILLLLIPIVLFNQRQYMVIGMEQITINWTTGLTFAFIASILIRGLAWDTSTDWYGYYEDFAGITSISDYARMEILYKYLVVALNYVTQKAGVFFVLVSALFIYSLMKVSSLYGKAMPYIMALWYFTLFLLSLNIFRQYIALSLIYMAVWYVFNKRYILSLTFIVAAVGFHTSAVIILPIIPLIYFLSLKEIPVYVWIGLVLVSTFASSLMLNFLLSYGVLFESIFSMGNGNVYSVLSLADDMYNNSYMALLSLSNCIVLFFASKIQNTYPNFKYFYIASALAFILIPICQHDIFMRMSLYLRIFVPVVTGVTLYHYRKERNRIPFILICLCVGISIVHFYTYLSRLGVNFPYDFRIGLLF